jgi:hypothetical protein
MDHPPADGTVENRFAAYGTVEGPRRLEAVLTAEGENEGSPVPVQTALIPGPGKRYLWYVSLAGGRAANRHTLTVRAKGGDKIEPAVRRFTVLGLPADGVLPRALVIQVNFPSEGQTLTVNSFAATGIDTNGVGDANWTLTHPCTPPCPGKGGIAPVDGSGNWSIPFTNLANATYTLHVYDAVDPVGTFRHFTVAV